MDNKALLYKLMYQAFLDIRSASYEGKPHKAIFKIADIFHNIPLQIERAEKENGSYEEIVNDLRDRAIRNGCESWLNNVIKQLTES